MKMTLSEGFEKHQSEVLAMLAANADTGRISPAKSASADALKVLATAGAENAVENLVKSM